MTFQAIIPIGGYTGWSFLQRTMDAQRERMHGSAEIKRDEDYFRANIGKINSAEELVANRRLLKITLGAFGLDADINSKFFIRKVLESSTLDTSALANRLADKSYLAMADAFGFGDNAIPNSRSEGFAEKILTAYATRSFETAVGEKDQSLRLALNAQRELEGLAAKSSSEATKWYTIMGSKPLREVFETAFGLPASFATLDLDVQMRVLREKTEAMTGADTISQFTDPDMVDKLIKRYLLRAESTFGLNGPGSAALAILQSSANSTSLLTTLLR